jgi:hypothetical protein
MSHSMIAAATATMTIAERKGAQFDSAIIDFMAISGLGNGHRARRRAAWDEKGRGTLIQRKNGRLFSNRWKFLDFDQRQGP